MVVYVFPKFRQNLGSSAIFRVDLAWNYPRGNFELRVRHKFGSSVVYVARKVTITKVFLILVFGRNHKHVVSEI